ncbi:MAG: Na(+)/H(+) antiporter subunit D [Rhodothalassiaceae bacterium]
MIAEFIPPAVWLFVGAVLVAVTRGPLRGGLGILFPLIALWASWQVEDAVMVSVFYLDQGLELVQGSPVRRLFATIFTLMAATGVLFGYKTAKGTELAAALAYAGGAVGICFSGDLLTLFLFWELMAIFSTVVIWYGGTDSAKAAGLRYAMVHFLGGIFLMVGIAGIYVTTGSLDVRAFSADGFPAWAMLIGVLVNTAAPPFSAWLSDAYPEASPSGTVFLSAFTTKSAVLTLILLFPGESVLTVVGLVMVFYGIIYALLENDARRILAYSIVNQVGFMVTAVGIGTETALNGAAAHAFAHIIYKALLLMSAGAVLYRTGKRRCTDLGGLFRTMPIACICGIIGALAISSFPLTSGYTTKTLISVAAEEEHLALVWYLLAAASAGVFLHAGIKFPWYVFFQKDSGLRPADAPWNMSAAMIFFAFLCVFLGVYPEPLWALLPYPIEFHPYAGYKLVFYLQLLLFSGLAFFLLLPWMKRTLTITLDTDWIYRVAIVGVARSLKRGWSAVDPFGRGWRVVQAIGDFITRHAEGGGALTRTWAIGTTALWILGLLTLYMVIQYL